MRACRWIEGEPRGASTRYCGAKAKPSSSYCDTHHRLAYSKAPPLPKIDALVRGYKPAKVRL